MRVVETKFLGREGIEIIDEHKKIFVTNELGGRILYYGTEEFNLLHECEFDENVVIKDIETSELKDHRDQLGWNDFGGYKTWLAPQTNWDGPPYLDLDRGTYEMTWEQLKNGDVKIIKISPICRETGMIIEREVYVHADSTKIDINHKLTSTTDEDCQWGIWDVTQVKKPCVSTIEGVMTKYEEFGEPSERDEFLNFDRGMIDAISPANETRGYKGYFLSDGAGFNTIFDIDGKKVHYLKEFEMSAEYEYAHNSNIEVYSDFNKNYAELEAHSPLFNFGKDNKSNYFTITWSFKLD